MLDDRANFSFFEGDIISPDDVTKCLREHQIDTVIHLAAQSNVDASFKNPYSFAATNIHGTQVLLECAKSCGVKKFIQMSSYEAYGASKAGPDGHREEDPLSPMNPYGAGKAAAEMLVTAFGNSSPLETIIVRANNIYGPNQFPDSICPPLSFVHTEEMLTLLVQRSYLSSSCFCSEGSSSHCMVGATSGSVICTRGMLQTPSISSCTRPLAGTSSTSALRTRSAIVISAPSSSSMSTLPAATRLATLPASTSGSKRHRDDPTSILGIDWTAPNYDRLAGIRRLGLTWDCSGRLNGTQRTERLGGATLARSWFLAHRTGGISDVKPQCQPWMVVVKIEGSCIDPSTLREHLQLYY